MALVVIAPASAPVTGAALNRAAHAARREPKMKDELTKTDAEAQLSADVKKKETGALDAVMAKYDGRRRTSMAYGLASDVLTQKAGKNAYKGVAIASFFLLVLAIAAMFGVSFAAGEILKDTEATNSTLATRDGSVLKTSPATHAMPLLVAPVLELAQLEKMQTMTVSYLDPANNNTKVKVVLGLTGAKKVSDVRVSFSVDSPWVEQVNIWDGVAYVVLPGAASPRDALRRSAAPPAQAHPSVARNAEPAFTMYAYNLVYKRDVYYSHVFCQT